MHWLTLIYFHYAIREKPWKSGFKHLELRVVYVLHKHVNMYNVAQLVIKSQQPATCISNCCEHNWQFKVKMYPIDHNQDTLTELSLCSQHHLLYWQTILIVIIVYNVKPGVRPGLRQVAGKSFQHFPRLLHLWVSTTTIYQ